MTDVPPAEATLRYDPEIGPGYFTQIRNDFLRYGGYPPTMKILYLVLLTYCGAGGTAFPGQARLAAHCGVSERTIRETVDALAAAGLLTVTRRGLNKTNLYYVHKFDLALMEDRQNLPVLSGKIPRSRPAALAGEKHGDQQHTVRRGPSAATIREAVRRAPLAADLTPAERAAVVAALTAHGPGWESALTAAILAARGT